MKIGVYTAIFGNKDQLKLPINYKKDSNIDYLLFTDNIDNAIFPYKVHKRAIVYDNITQNARYYKIMGDDVLSNYDLLIWHDANIQLYHTKIEYLVAKAENSFLTTFTHPDRDDFYSEAMSCIRVGKDFSLRILRQAIVYFFKGMPTHQGMYSTGILIKNIKFKQENLLLFWWLEVLNFSRRDQLSFSFMVYKKKLKVSVIDDDIFNNKYSIYHKHSYEAYRERKNIMSYNYKFLRLLSMFIIQVLRKIKKLYK